MATHLCGYHGSSRDVCFYCKESYADESQFCQAATDRERQNREYRDNMEKMARAAIGKLTREEVRSITHMMIVDPSGNWAKDREDTP